MRRLFLAMLALWATALSPGLCVAGVLEHLCTDCPEAVACDHEDACATDPCVEPVVRPVSNADVAHFAPVLSLATRYVLIEFDRSPNPLSALDPFPPERKNLPRPESDLPLRN